MPDNRQATYMQLIETMLNDHRTYAHRMLLADNDAVWILPDGTNVPKADYIIIETEQYEFRVFYHQDHEICFTVNKINRKIMLGYEVELTQDYYGRGTIAVVDRTNHEFFSLPMERYSMYGEYGHRFILPFGIVSAHPYGDGSSHMTRDNDMTMGFYVTNNMTSFVIEASGTIDIGPNGIKYRERNSDNWIIIATTSDMLEIFGNGIINKIWDYAQSQADSPIEKLVKNRIREIVEGGQNG